MPGLNGLQVCEALRADADPKLRRVPVVLVTAFGSEDETAAGFAAGVTDFVIKPFRPAHLLTRVQAWLLRGQRVPLPGE
jgi:two-component system phosphate regulon response regulator PhoB